MARKACTGMGRGHLGEPTQGHWPLAARPGGKVEAGQMWMSTRMQQTARHIWGLGQGGSESSLISSLDSALWFLPTAAATLWAPAACRHLIHSRTGPPSTKIRPRGIHLPAALRGSLRGTKILVRGQAGSSSTSMWPPPQVPLCPESMGAPSLPRVLGSTLLHPESWGAHPPPQVWGSNFSALSPGEHPPAESVLSRPTTTWRTAQLRRVAVLSPGLLVREPWPGGHLEPWKMLGGTAASVRCG